MVILLTNLTKHVIKTTIKIADGWGVINKKVPQNVALSKAVEITV